MKPNSPEIATEWKSLASLKPDSGFDVCFDCGGLATWSHLMVRISHKLSNSFDGALAGGGDPASSPLYVFGPFLRLIVLAGVAPVTFGASIWLVVLTVVVVSAMYRLVMGWVTDGSGGSGLSEEEFGGWAMKMNAAITIVEYTLTFLVSIAALVTFVADRYTFLDQAVFGIGYRTIVAILLSVVIGGLVNRGPRVAARSFGPATLAVLLLLWAMVIATLWRFGFRLPAFHLSAFGTEYLHFTLSGYSHILALMTGIEVFANLVAAYDGSAQERSRRAFGSLTIIMGTTLVTMLVVGPAILRVSNPSDPLVSVFTQTMDRLLPRPLPYLGTFVGVIVLASAAAASAQGLQNLALGLRYRNYIPAFLGRRNRYEVADRPVWLEVAVASFCFLVFGTRDETYLTLYAAGVFVLLSMTGWASVKRLLRYWSDGTSKKSAGATLGAIIAAILTTGASGIIFYERFLEGAWAYLLFIPILFVGFGYIRSRLGAPAPLEDHLGRFYTGQYLLPYQRRGGMKDETKITEVDVVLDGTASAEHGLKIGEMLSKKLGSKIRLISIADSAHADSGVPKDYLNRVAAQLRMLGVPVEIADTSDHGKGPDLIVVTTQTASAIQHLFHDYLGPVIRRSETPLFVLRPTDDWRSRWTQFRRLLVCLDGSESAEQVLPYTRLLMGQFKGHILLLAVPEMEVEEDRLGAYLEGVAKALKGHGHNVEVVIAGVEPAPTIIGIATERQADLIVMANNGRGGAAHRSAMGSVTEQLLHGTPCPLLIVPAGNASPTDLIPTR